MPDISPYFPITDPTLIFFVVLLIILFAPIIMSRLRIPHIIGMVLAGVLIGQYGLNILQRDSSFELFGKVGVLYIMFLAGLEMNLTDLRKKVNHFLLFGLLTFAIPFATAYPVCVYLLGYSSTASLLMSCIFASNTLIAYPIVCKFGLQKHPAVALSVGSSMIALTASLIILAALVGAHSNETEGFTFWLMFASRMVLFCVGSVMIIPRLTRWFFRRYSDAVMLYIYVMSVLFLSAAMSEMCGLEGIFGAFLAGLILNRFIPSVSPLMNRIEFIGNALFIPYFLIGVGMLIDIRVLFHGLDTVWVVCCMVLFGTLSKALAAYLTSFSLKLPLQSGHMMFGLTEAHAAGGIAMTMVGMRMHTSDGQYLVDANMLNGVVMMILFTCIISSVVVENTSKQILLKGKLQPDENEHHNDEKIMVSLQKADDVESLMQLAIMMRNKKLDRGLIGLNVVYDDINSSRNQSNGRRVLEKAIGIATAADVRMVTQTRLATNIANGIKHAFLENDASEIIMALHRRISLDDSFWGAYTQGLVNEINRQIIIVRTICPYNTLRKIHVAVPSRGEYEPGFYRWIERLARLASNLGCRILFHARPDTNALISDYVQSHHPDVRAEYLNMLEWKELLTLNKWVNNDHLVVIITARQGTVSYKPVFEHLPEEITRCFSKCSLMIIYPDQHGQQQGSMTFTAPQRQEGESAYSSIVKWINKKKQKD